MYTRLRNHQPLHEKLWSGNLRGRDTMEYPDVDGRIILKYICCKQSGHEADEHNLEQMLRMSGELPSFPDVFTVSCLIKHKATFTFTLTLFMSTLYLLPLEE
jgi:hypothetical protein